MHLTFFRECNQYKDNISESQNCCLLHSILFGKLQFLSITLDAELCTLNGKLEMSVSFMTTANTQFCIQWFSYAVILFAPH